MARRNSLEHAAQLEARARDIRATAARAARSHDTRSKVLLGALVLLYAQTVPGGVRFLEALAALPVLKERDAEHLAAHLPAELSAPFKKGSPA